jgi:hypothetical protein
MMAVELLTNQGSRHTATREQACWVERGMSRERDSEKRDREAERGASTGFFCLTVFLTKICSRKTFYPKGGYKGQRLARAQLDTQIKSGANPLLIASETGQIELVQLLLSLGSNPRLCNLQQDYTPLLVASQNGHVHVVKALVEALAKVGCGVNEKTMDGYTPLALACSKGHWQVCLSFCRSELECLLLSSCVVRKRKWCFPLIVDDTQTRAHPYFLFFFLSFFLSFTLLLCTPFM